MKYTMKTDFNTQREAEIEKGVVGKELAGKSLSAKDLTDGVKMILQVVSFDEI